MGVVADSRRLHYLEVVGTIDVLLQHVGGVRSPLRRETISTGPPGRGAGVEPGGIGLAMRHSRSQRPRTGTGRAR